jgi:hypothetical protein
VPKVKWSSGISAADIDGADDSRNFSPYDGPTPPPGVYGFVVKQMELSKTSNGNPQIVLGLELTDRGRVEHKKFAGYYLRDFIVVLPQTAFRIKPLLKALRVSAEDFTDRLVRDEENNVITIGKVKPVGQTVVVNLAVNKGQKSDQYPRQVGTYLPAKAQEDTADSGSADSADDEDAPF